MMKHYRKSRRSSLSRSVGKIFPSIALVLAGSGGFYVAMQWFRHDAEDTEAHAQTVEQATAPTAETDTLQAAAAPSATSAASEAMLVKTQEESAPLVSDFDGQTTGKIQRYLTPSSADMIVLAYLPALDMAADSYHVWLLKDGLADVKDMGSLAPRADGSWVLNFTAGPGTGIVDPRLYKTAVIMREPNDGNPGPSGNKIAEAKF